VLLHDGIRPQEKRSRNVSICEVVVEGIMRTVERHSDLKFGRDETSTPLDSD
jgi:hypothetical protein